MQKPLLNFEFSKGGESAHRTLFYFYLFCQFIRFLIRLEEHKQHSLNQED